MASLQSSSCMLLTTNHKTPKISSASARRFHVSCGVDRRNMLLGLRGLYGAATNLKALADPDINSCGMPPDENCCPPSSDAIKDYERIFGDLINDLTFALPFSIFNEISCNPIHRPPTVVSNNLATMYKILLSGFSKTEDFMGQFYMVGNPPPPGDGGNIPNSGGLSPNNEEIPFKRKYEIEDENGKAIVVITLRVFPVRLQNYLVGRTKDIVSNFFKLRIKRTK